MLIRNATRHEITAALAAVNTRYGGNVIFRRFDAAGVTRKGGEKFKVGLRVKSSKGPGAKRGHGRTKAGDRVRSCAACWHVYGHFFDALPAGSDFIVSNGRRDVIKKPGDPWQDRQIGSMMDPLLFSHACDCTGENRNQGSTAPAPVKLSAEVDLGKIIAYENDELGREETITLFRSLINSGMAWSLQGHYGRTAAALIREGHCTAPAGVR